MTRRKFAVGQVWRTRDRHRFRIVSIGPPEWPFLLGLVNEGHKQTLCPDGRFVAAPSEGQKKSLHPLDLVELVLTDC
jgi:hypothetical protein